MTDILPPRRRAAPTTGISLDTSRLASSANLKKAGEKFEAVFIGMMLKSMRQAKLGDGLFDTKKSERSATCRTSRSPRAWPRTSRSASARR